MEEFKMVAIIKLIRLNYFESESEWRKSVFEWIWDKITRCLNQDGSVWIQYDRIQDGCHHQVESEWMSEVLFMQNGWIQDGRLQDGCHHQVESEWMSEVIVVQNGWIQDGCHHQVESEWMTLIQIELVGVRVLSKMTESKMSEFKMGAIIKLSQNEWVKFFCTNGGNQSWQVWVSMRGQTKMDESKMAKFKMAVFKMAAII